MFGEPLTAVWRYKFAVCRRRIFRFRSEGRLNDEYNQNNTADVCKFNMAAACSESMPSLKIKGQMWSFVSTFAKQFQMMFPVQSQRFSSIALD